MRSFTIIALAFLATVGPAVCAPIPSTPDTRGVSGRIAKSWKEMPEAGKLGVAAAVGAGAEAGVKQLYDYLDVS
ncbi:hypothetical protein BC835DRAFT_1382473 [Cytidiella melzeri]|nr:hypothetical protein BC835DRAFT_1382454 [Cytidiella melzeri]KAI0685773.1 hypothetical protein BC835DRAFT_1382473 [Cytidiella melzeri]